MGVFEPFNLSRSFFPATKLFMGASANSNSSEKASSLIKKNPLFRKFSAQPTFTYRTTAEQQPSPEEVIIEHTTSLDYLRQYCKIRKQIYESFYHIELEENPDKQDESAEIFVVRIKGKCIGGARIVPHDPSLENKLGFETEKFELLKVFPELEGKSFCEFSRLAILPEYRNGKYSIRLYKVMRDYSLANGYQYAFAFAPIIPARQYRMAFAKMGYKIEILEEIKGFCNPLYSHLNPCLMVLYLDGQLPSLKMSSAFEAECKHRYVEKKDYLEI